jgi:CRP-like cAMP-binding protein
MLGFAMKDKKIQAIGRVPMFHKCSSKELEFLSKQMDEVTVPAGEVLTRQGEPGHTFYVILEGEAEVTIDGQRRANLREGDFLGEISMVDRGPATATVMTVAPSRLLLMSHDQFRNAVHLNDDISMRVLREMSARLMKNEAAGFKSVRPEKPRRV